ncbi:ATP-binding protein [Nocardia neocaledoniensis]|uniref:ATP-binding protein n=1 Tax=Nocardia neocaledoniensis TaxID=236511 RepID=UPI002454AAD6|nr:ATP-binding protein [Nocardia neocaledoniensis]
MDELPAGSDEGKTVEGKAASGASPYSTGGGGVTFERKVAVQYLTRMLTQTGAVELGPGRSIRRVTFQQAPRYTIDDLVIHAGRDGESDASLVLAMGVRRAPQIIPSSEPTVKLFRSFLSEVDRITTGGPRLRLALVVADKQPHAEQLAELAALATGQDNPLEFFDDIYTPKKFSADLRQRLEHLKGIVKSALTEDGSPSPETDVVQRRTWEVLRHLLVLMPRLETPDESDWAELANQLVPFARGKDLAAGTALRDRLLALASDYSPRAARIDRTLLRRDTHDQLDEDAGRHKGWRALELLGQQARDAVRMTIASADGSRVLKLRRAEAEAGLLAAALGSDAVVVHGQSGSGKSALVRAAIEHARSSNPGALQAQFINLRHLPKSSLLLEQAFDVPLQVLLCELSAPQRILVIDGADAFAENPEALLSYLVDAAIRSEVTVLVLTTDDNRQMLVDTLRARYSNLPELFEVPLLDDTEIDQIVTRFEEMEALALGARSRDLLRRPVVVDLLVRGGIEGVPLSESDAMEQVWNGLVLQRERPDRGYPDARNIVMLRLADLQFRGGDALAVASTLDPAALEGLRRDGLLRTSPENPFVIEPEFAHDEIRRYALARLLLSTGEIGTALSNAGAPRWVLGAARLACQAELAMPDSPIRPAHGRYATMRRTFDALVDAGHGARWGDVPGEALMGLGDPAPVLRDAWPLLREDGDAGVKNLCRLIDQRLRDSQGMVRAVAVEPVIALLLEQPTPWRAGDYMRNLLRDWLGALSWSSAPVGHPLRITLRRLLADAAAAADRRATEAELQRASKTETAAPPVRSAQMPRRSTARRPAGRSRIPREIREEVVVELWALLGPDLGDDGVAILRRLALEAPEALAPALEETLATRALALFDPKLLTELTEAYYLDAEADSRFVREVGIRPHKSRTLGFSPRGAWYRGAFALVFQTDFRGGVTVLNRMLNHAALLRARTLARHGNDYGVASSSEVPDKFRIMLTITGEPKEYVGDPHVWLWYRGTGVGPAPCFSALQALERECDRWIAAGISLETLTALLLEGCENIAMVALATGLIVRHLKPADRALDPYLAEPEVWSHESVRLAHEYSGLAADSEGIAAADRRQLALGAVVMPLVAIADNDRVEQLRAIGDRLVANARRAASRELGTEDPEAVERHIATVRVWAGYLDRGTYIAKRADGQVYIESQPPAEVSQALEPLAEYSRRSSESARLNVRYNVNGNDEHTRALGSDEMAADLTSAQNLFEDPDWRSSEGWDVPAMVSAAALEAHLIRAIGLPGSGLRFAATILLQVGEGESPRHEYEYHASYFEQGATRSAARALPLLLLPVAGHLREQLSAGDNAPAYGRIVAAATNLATDEVDEVRLHLGRGLDNIWPQPCSSLTQCHHETAYQLVVATMRNCIFGDWDIDGQKRPIVALADPVEESLATVNGNDILPSRLDAAIRALASAATRQHCVSEKATTLLKVVVEAHRRSLQAQQRSERLDLAVDERGSHALIVARALLTLAAHGSNQSLIEHIAGYREDPILLSAFLSALSAAAEESPNLAAAAHKMWPDLVTNILRQLTGESSCSRLHHDSLLESLLPNAAGEYNYLYPEIDDVPIVWWTPKSWHRMIEQWLPHAHGRPGCLETLIRFLAFLEPADRANIGIPWLSEIVMADPFVIAKRCPGLVSRWLIDVYPEIRDLTTQSTWQSTVDALVVAGVARLAPYSE